MTKTQALRRIREMEAKARNLFLDDYLTLNDLQAVKKISKSAVNRIK